MKSEKPSLTQVMKAIEEEILRAKHQMGQELRQEVRNEWKRYIEDLEGKHTDIQLLGLFEDEEEDEPMD